MAGHIRPGTTATYNLGSTTLQWISGFFSGNVDVRDPGDASPQTRITGQRIDFGSGTVLDSSIVRSTAALVYTAKIPDAATAAAHVFDNGITLSGDRLITSFQNHGSEKSGILFDGSLRLFGSDGGGSHLDVSPVTTFTNWVLKFPAAAPAGNGYTLQGDTDGTTAWVNVTSSGANTALSNLASVAINASLVPGSDNSIDVGSSAKRWTNGYIQSLFVLTSASDANPVVKLSTSGLQFGAGGGSATDIRLYRSAGTTLSLIGSLIPDAAGTYFLGSSTRQWTLGFFSGNVDVRDVGDSSAQARLAGQRLDFGPGSSGLDVSIIRSGGALGYTAKASAASEAHVFDNGTTLTTGLIAAFYNNTVKRSAILFDGSFRLFSTDGGGAHLDISPATTFTSYAIVMPAAQGAANTVLTNNGSGALSWSPPSTDPNFQFLPAQNEPPAANPATFTLITAATGQRALLEFDGSTDETGIMSGVLRNYRGGGVTVTFKGTMDSTNTGTKVVKLAASFELVQSADVLGAGGNDFASAQTAEIVVNNTIGTMFEGTITFTDGAQMDSVTTGKLFRFKITRNNTGLSGTNATGRYRMLAAVCNNT
jgi:hypothetical protein